MPTEVKWTLAIAVGCGLVWAGWEVTWILVTLACSGMSAAGGGNHAAKRECRGFSRRIRRSRQPDGVWTPRPGVVSFPGHYVVRDRIHVVFPCAVAEARTGPRSGESHQFHLRADSEDRAGTHQASGETGDAAARDAQAGSRDARAAIQFPGDASAGRSQALGEICYNRFEFFPSRKWRNWQTHHLEGVAPQGVWVRIPPSAPSFSMRSTKAPPPTDCNSSP